MDTAGKATTTTDPAGKTRSDQRDGSSWEDTIQPKGRQIEPGRSQVATTVNPAGKAAVATDPTKAMKAVGTDRR